jgi:hypothetical protein
MSVLDRNSQETGVTRSRLLLATMVTIAAFVVSDAIAGRPGALDVQAAQAEFVRSSGCSLENAQALMLFVAKYGGRKDPALRLLVARARFQAGSILRYRNKRNEAIIRFAEITRLYRHDSDIRIRRLVAASHLMLGGTERDDKTKEEHLRKVISDYSASDDGELRQVYARALFGLSDIRRRAGLTAQADALAQKADEALHTGPLPGKSIEDTGSICV